MNKEMNYIDLLMEIKQCETIIKQCEDRGITESRQYGKARSQLKALEKLSEEVIKKRHSLYHPSPWFKPVLLPRHIDESEWKEVKIQKVLKIWPTK